MQRKLLIIFCLFLFIDSYAQKETTSFSLHYYTTENGLPSNLIRGIQWDDNSSFLWIITEGGLVRLNGVDIKSYNKEKISPIAPQKEVYAVKNNAGTIFISDGSGNIYEIKKNTPVLSKSASLNNSFINYHFIFVSDTFFTSKIKTSPVFTAPFTKIICLSDTSCLILFQNTLYLYSVSLKEPVALALQKQNISSIFKINNTCFFVDNNKKTFIINTNTLTASTVNFIANDNDLLNFNSGFSQLYWQTGMLKPIVIKSNKAWALDYIEGNIVANLLTDVLPADANISSVEYTEKNRMLIIGTESKGVILISQNLVQPKKRKNANPKNKNAYYSQIALDNGNILTNEGDIIGNYNNDESKLPFRGKFSNRISLTNDNLIWYNATNSKLGYNCLHQFNKISGQTKVFDKIKLLTLVEISGSKTYLANNKGIGLLQNDSILYLHEYPKGIKNINTYDFKEISPGILAVAGCSGLLRFNIASNKLDTIYSKENACFGSIWKYKDYIFWGSYGFGYYIYKNGVIKEMPVDKNEYLLYCHCFVADAYGFCWISTNRGLFKAGLDDIIAHFENGSTPVYYHYFGRKDGIEMTELNGGCIPCALTLKDQTISFPSMDGLLWVNPVTANPILPAGDIYIDEVLIDNKNINPDSLKNITLASTVQEIVFKLGFSAWGNKENLYIDYQLNDTVRWKKIKAEDNTFLQFNNLPSGKYTLRIRKLNGFGINNYAYKTIEFIIARRWFNQWWFYLLLFGIAIGLVGLFGKIRNNQFIISQRKLEKQVAEKTNELQQKNEVLEKSNSINTRLISIISHDIITPLKFLNVAGKNLLEKKKLMTEELKDETIKEITNTSKELQLLSTNILNWIKYQNENRRLAKEQFYIYEMVNQIFGIQNSMAHQKNLKLVNDADRTMQIVQYFEPLKILLYNLITNAINFSEKGTITITTQSATEKIVISVTDQGVGMTQDQIKNIMADQFIVSSANMDNRKGNGLGYLIIKDLLKMMEAKLIINSEKGSGTKVSVQFSVTKN